MKRDELKELGVEKIDEVMALYGKSVNTYKDEITKLENKVIALQKEIVEKTDTTTEKDATIKDLETKVGNLDETQKQLEELKATIAERELKELQAKEQELFIKEFDALVGERKFINDYTKNAVVKEFKTALEGKDDANKQDVFNNLVKDKEDLFENPNKVKIPKTGEVNTNATKEAHYRRLMGLEDEK